ncbi:MAG: group II intron reverse transcriptase/maturase, partial [Armatimonadota bacterium]
MGAVELPSSDLAEVFSHTRLRAAFERVAAKRGAPGIDRQTIEQFGRHLDRNLHRLADDVLSSRYRANPVRRVYIPKRSGGLRPLGIPTVRDRLAQATVHEYAQPTWEPLFLDCSYAYRPGRSIFDAIDRV